MLLLLWKFTWSLIQWIVQYDYDHAKVSYGINECAPISVLFIRHNCFGHNILVTIRIPLQLQLHLHVLSQLMYLNFLIPYNVIMNLWMHVHERLLFAGCHNMVIMQPFHCARPKVHNFQRSWLSLVPVYCAYIYQFSVAKVKVCHRITMCSFEIYNLYVMLPSYFISVRQLMLK